MILNTICVILIVSGLIFFIGGAVGVIRFPDFYTRMHAAGKGDTMSVFLILIGLALYQLGDFNTGNLLVAGKILFITIFVMWASPTSTHALIKAGMDEGQKMWERKQDEEGDSDA
jgi:multicomponent Na+:H+ antiporter subunit G